MFARIYQLVNTATRLRTRSGASRPDLRLKRSSAGSATHENSRSGLAGNAVLFSLLIMSSGLITALGMASIVVGEVQSVGLIAPAERSYYKAESYVEQALWNKRLDPTYDIVSYDDLNNAAKNPNHKELPCVAAGAVPADQCFSTDPKKELTGGQTTEEGVLQKPFYASTATQSGSKVLLTRDDAYQLDVNTFDPGISLTGKTATLRLRGMTFASSGAQTALQVLIAAYPGTSPFPGGTGISCNGTSPGYCGANTGSGGQTTPVFIDEKLIRPGTAGGTDPDPYNITLGSGTSDKTGQAYPPLSGYHYRIRIKALGSDAQFIPSATTNLNETLQLQTPDFHVLAVAQDGQTRRGIRVVAPATNSSLAVFDYVLFSDLAINKDAKKPATRAIEAKAYRIPNGSGNTTPACQTTTAGTTPLDTVPFTVGAVTLTTGGSYGAGSGPGTGLVRFLDLDSTGTYTLTAGNLNDYELCNQAQKTQTFGPTAANTDTVQTAQPCIYRPICRVTTTTVTTTGIVGYTTTTGIIGYTPFLGCASVDGKGNCIVYEWVGIPIYGTITVPVYGPVQQTVTVNTCPPVPTAGT